MKANTKHCVRILKPVNPISLPPELSLEFTCGTETSVACMLVTDAAVTAGAGLFLLKEKLKKKKGENRKQESIKLRNKI